MLSRKQYHIANLPVVLLLVSITFFLFSKRASAQFTLQINIKSIPASHQTDKLFAAGNFNGWNPADSNARFSRSGDSATLVINGLKAGQYEFKCTRGTWNTVEVTRDGNAISNRSINLNSDTALDFSIDAWSDDFIGNKTIHTASSNVYVMDTAFFMPQLYRTRKIWIYLPPGYESGKKRYPVIYMQDGQNLFDERTSAYGEWRIDECLDSLIKIDKPPAIVVGIENGSRRVNEYNPYDSKDYGNGEGGAYVDFMVETLKPYIDKHYRTLPSRENTFIAGSSLGALISYYAILRYPQVFGKAGMFSPAFWIAPEIRDLTDSMSSRLNGQFFFYAGETESERMISDIQVLADKLGENSNALIYFVTDPLGKHNEMAWSKWFAEFYLWVGGNGLSYQVKIVD